MGKYYAQWRRPPRKERPWRVHPIWRGIGCILVILIPLFSFLLADSLVQTNLETRWVTVPFELTGPPAFPYLYAKLVMTVFVAVIIFAVYTLFYMIIYSMLGPSRYGPLDAKPVKKKARPRRARR